MFSSTFDSYQVNNNILSLLGNVPSNSISSAHSEALSQLKKSNPRLYSNTIRGYSKYGPSARLENGSVVFPKDWDSWYKNWERDGNAKAAFNVAKKHGVFLNSPEDHVKFATFHEYGHISSGIEQSTSESIFHNLIDKKFRIQSDSLTSAVNAVEEKYGSRAESALWKISSIANDIDSNPRLYRTKPEESAADLFAIRMMKKDAHRVADISIKNVSNLTSRTNNIKGKTILSNGYSLLSKLR